MYYLGFCSKRKDNIQEEVSWYEKAIEHDDDLARVGLGMRYLNGGIGFDFEKARELFETALENGCAEANYGMGILYENDAYDVERDTDKALRYFEEAAKSEDSAWASNAYREISYIYKNGIGVEKDLEKALEYQTKASDISKTYFGDDIIRLGDIYDEMGESEKAKECYNEGITDLKEQGDAGSDRALCVLGAVYTNDKVIERDGTKALEYLEKAAERNNPRAFNYIGILYLNGYGVEQDYDKAMDYFEKSAELGHVDSIMYLGSMFYRGSGVSQDYEKAMNFFLLASTMGDAVALNNMGYMYCNGEGTESDVEKGIQYLKDAANAGEFLGLSIIGAMYYYGDLVEQDYDKAMEYFRKAVENGESHGDALNFIGLMYENGDGVETDYQIAFEYYEKAAKLGHETAKKNIRKLVDNGHISREEAAEWVD